MLQESPWLVAIAIAILVAFIAVMHRSRRLFRICQELEEYADALLQHGQGTILGVHGIVSELDSDHPVRHRIEQVLARAERELSEMREGMQSHCSKQQEDLIQ